MFVSNSPVLAAFSNAKIGSTIPVNFPSFCNVIPGGNSPSPSCIKYSNVSPATVSGSTAINWKSNGALSIIKNVLLGPTGKRSSLVVHTGSSGPVTIMLNVLSSITPFCSARTTKVYFVSLLTS